MKTCTLCKIEKPLAEYGSLKRTFDGLNFWCKPCLKIKKAEYYLKHKDAYREVKAANDRKRNTANPEANRARAKAWREANPAKSKESKKRYHAKNREVLREISRARYRANKEDHLAKCAKWAASNHSRVRAYQVSYYRAKRKEDPLYAATAICRCRVASAFRRMGFSKTSTTAELLGCDFETLRLHIESLFQPGMTWENRGFYGWHIDHKIPLASAESEASLRSLCHYKNLQPLWASDNFKKGAKMPTEWEGVNHGRLDHLQADRR